MNRVDVTVSGFTLKVGNVPSESGVRHDKKVCLVDKRKKAPR